MEKKGAGSRWAWSTKKRYAKNEPHATVHIKVTKALNSKLIYNEIFFFKLLLHSMFPFFRTFSYRLAIACEPGCNVL